MITEIQTTDIAMGLKKGVRPKSRKPKTAANKYVKGRWGHSEKCGMMGGLKPFSAKASDSSSGTQQLSF